VQDCGHSSFCFTCLKGLKRCPICEVEIKTWAPLKKKTKFNPMILSLGGAFDAAVDPLIPKAKKGANQPEQQKKLDDEPALCFDDLMDSDDDHRGNYVSWSSDDIHKRGGSCSVQTTFKGSSKCADSAVLGVATESLGQLLEVEEDLVLQALMRKRGPPVDDPEKVTSVSEEHGVASKPKKLKSLSILQSIAPSAKEPAASTRRTKASKLQKGSEKAPTSRAGFKRTQTVPAKFKNL
jgi:hypothetical protein